MANHKAQTSAVTKSTRQCDETIPYVDVTQPRQPSLHFAEVVLTAVHSLKFKSVEFIDLPALLNIL